MGKALKMPVVPASKPTLAELGGRTKSPAQAKARAANGKKGGRPRKPYAVFTSGSANARFTAATEAEVLKWIDTQPVPKRNTKHYRVRMANGGEYTMSVHVQWDTNFNALIPPDAPTAGAK